MCRQGVSMIGYMFCPPPITDRERNCDIRALVSTSTTFRLVHLLFFIRFFCFLFCFVLFCFVFHLGTVEFLRHPYLAITAACHAQAYLVQDSNCQLF
jgi:hypothetical protein